MEQDRARGVSLWLMPEVPAGERLAAVISSFAARLGTRPFPPHLTLLPAILGRETAEVLDAARRLAEGLFPLEVRLAAVEVRDEHFRCLIAVAADDGRLRAAHVAAAHAFGREPDPAFLPHVSLVYGSLAPATKRAIAKEAAPVAALTFETAHLHVWRTEGPVEEWGEMGVFPLGGRPEA